MDMIVVLIVSFVLASLPLLMAGFFRAFSLPRKMLVVRGELETLAPQPSSSPVDSSKLDELAEKYFSKSRLLLPSVLLTFLYLAIFALCDSYLSLRYANHSISIFPVPLVLIARPLLFALVGVYLFNLGTIVRRLYLADINEQVFWGAVNRLLLSTGLALVILKLGLDKTEGMVYFSIGFLANIVLDWILEQTLKVLNINKPKQDDLPLQMVRGINIWKEYRLGEEGIENVQNLATADVVDLAVRTHYSLRTLIDWIDQALVLTRLTSDQVKMLSSQAVALSAIELATAAPENSNGDETFAKAMAARLNVDAVLFAATLNRLFEDEYVRKLWALWQSGTDSPGSLTVRFPLQPSPTTASPRADQQDR